MSIFKYILKNVQIFVEIYMAIFYMDLVVAFASHPYTVPVGLISKGSPSRKEAAS